MKIRDTRQKLIEAGAKAMLVKSYHAVGIKEVLDDVGVPKGSFYHYFKSKEHFGTEVIEHAVAEHIERLRQYLADRGRSPLGRFRAFFESGQSCYHNMQYRQACLISKLATEVSEMSPTMRAALKSGLDQWRTLFAQFIREAQAEGEIDPQFDPEALAGFVQFAWEGAVMRMQVDQNGAPLENFRVYIFDHLLAR
ncbi:TetR family transcriptional regulator [Desulfonema ishimotonii]|uniref:TetR family transcriptional regulator n=1 Tax=Desulfonema ishimotonii TaxID=45657 RepID=A0A401FUE3_9BACT|nr:TetR/AcrR family transcriptional regulator [Desulfonema ishimotonii]GBC60581.1 TetR family transcriptional regulator [Desulfonema ishimotonii]